VKRAITALLASLMLAGALAGATESVSKMAQSGVLSLGDGSFPAPVGSPGTFSYGDATSR
jgi:uncharacterized membrane protein